jgi:hypothetical protein
VKLSRGGGAFDFFFLAMAHGKRGQRDEGRKWYDKAVAWVDKNREMLDKDRPAANYLRRFQREAEDILKQNEK